MADNLIAARTHLAWQSLAAGNNGNTTLANDFSRVALMLAGCGELAAMLGGAAKELREAAIPHNEVADLLEAVIGKAPVPAKAEPLPAVTQLPRVDLKQPAKGGAYLVELPPCPPPAIDALYRWQVKPGESWQTDANKQVIRAYGPLEERKAEPSGITVPLADLTKDPAPGAYLCFYEDGSIISHYSGRTPWGRTLIRAYGPLLVSEP